MSILCVLGKGYHRLCDSLSTAWVAVHGGINGSCLIPQSPVISRLMFIMSLTGYHQTIQDATQYNGFTLFAFFFVCGLFVWYVLLCLFSKHGDIYLNNSYPY